MKRDSADFCKQIIVNDELQIDFYEEEEKEEIFGMMVSVRQNSHN